MPTRFFWIAALSSLVWAQDTRVSFEVAAIRSNQTGVSSMQIRSLTGNRFSVANASVRQLVLLAYGPARTRGGSLPEMPVEGPEWTRVERFDIEATPGNGINATAVQTQQMLQRLLEERFSLRIQREIRDGPVYLLSVSTRGSRLTAAAGDTRSLDIDAGHIQATNQPLSAFVSVLAGPLGRPVLDRTGLMGRYDFQLTWAPDPLSSELGLPSLFTAVQEQLGLRLEPGTGPVETLAIERVERPTAN